MIKLPPSTLRGWLYLGLGIGVLLILLGGFLWQKSAEEKAIPPHILVLNLSPGEYEKVDQILSVDVIVNKTRFTQIAKEKKVLFAVMPYHNESVILTYAVFSEGIGYSYSEVHRLGGYLSSHKLEGTRLTLEGGNYVGYWGIVFGVFLLFIIIAILVVLVVAIGYSITYLRVRKRRLAVTH